LEDGSVDSDNLKLEARELERQGRFREALAMYRHILTSVEGKPELLQELPLYVKAGDLYLKLDNPKAAVSLYEQVGKIYAAHGSASSAKAICAKVLRVMPERTHVYRRLAGIMVDHGHIEAGREVMVEWAERFRLADTHGSLERLSGRSEVELLPAMLMLLELAERLEAVEPEALPVPAIAPTRPDIVELELDSEQPSEIEAAPVSDDLPPAEPEPAAEPELSAEGEGAADTDEPGLPGPVLHAASWDDKLEFRSEPFGAESLAPADSGSEPPEDQAAPPSEPPGAEVESPIGPDDLLIVPGHMMTDQGPKPPAGASAQPAPPTEGGSASPEPTAASGGRRVQGPDRPARSSKRPAFLEPEPASPRSRPRRSPVGSVLFPMPTQAGIPRGWKVVVGLAGAVLLILLLWIAFGMPPFGGSESEVGAMPREVPVPGETRAPTG
jgi:hypothetical protein